MTNEELAAWLVVIPLTAVVLWRAPAAVRVEPTRILWWIFVALDAAMITRIDAVGTTIYDLTGLADAATLTKHLCGIVAVACLLRWVTTVVPGREDGSREPAYRRAISNRPRRVVTWAAVVAVICAFPFAYRRHDAHAEDADFIFQQAGHLWGSVHLLLFYGYLIFGMACAALMCTSAARESTGIFHYSMRAVSFGCLLGSCYGIVRSGYLIIRLCGKPFLGGDALVDVASNLSLDGCVILVIAGTSGPVYERISCRYRAYAALNDLHPLWSRLTTAVPQVVYTSPRLRLPVLLRFYDFWVPTHSHERLDRRLTEIADAALVLQNHVEADRDAVEGAVQEMGLPSHYATASLLTLAISRREHGEPPAPTESFTPLLPQAAERDRLVSLLLPVGGAMSKGDIMKRISTQAAVLA